MTTLAASIERVYCGKCPGAILDRSYSGGWVSKFKGRSIKIRGHATVEVTCSNGHTTTVEVDGESVSVVI